MERWVEPISWVASLPCKAHLCPRRAIASIARPRSDSILISTDAEWGLGMLIIQRVLGRAPRLGAANDTALTRAFGREVGHVAGHGHARQLRPVVDVNSNPANPVIGSRSFEAY